MPCKPQEMSDLIVVIPGIMGSALSIGNKPVWGLSCKAIIGNILSLGKNLDRLALPDGIGDNDPKDGVFATHLLPDLHLLPGLWSIDGYGKLVHYLRSHFILDDVGEKKPGNLMLFPYDWRLSNVVSAKRLAIVVERELERWRKVTSNKEAKLIFICHSMGGLVARYFLEVIGGHEITRKLITIGTPYQGSVNAVERLVNGFSNWLGPMQDVLIRLSSSLPSLYQLLPNYPCLDTGDGNLLKLTKASLPNLENSRVKAASDFHQKINDCAKSKDAKYEIIAIKGHVQPTAQTAYLERDTIIPIKLYGGVDRGGDGTVPRPSSHPPEWEGETRTTIFAAQKHASLQNSEGILQQLFGALTGHLGKWLGDEQIGVEMPDVIEAGNHLPIFAKSKSGDTTLVLQAIVNREDGKVVSEPLLLQNKGWGVYSEKMKDLRPGCYRITVESAVPQRPVESVTDITLVWDKEAFKYNGSK